MFGDALHQAMDAFVEELIDFFPDPRARINLRKLLAEGTKVRGRMLDRAEQVLASFDADREANRLYQLVWHCAGVLGIDPGPFTLRELCLMAETRCRER